MCHLPRSQVLVSLPTIIATDRQSYGTPRRARPPQRVGLRSRRRIASLSVNFGGLNVKHDPSAGLEEKTPVAEILILYHHKSAGY